MSVSVRRVTDPSGKHRSELAGLPQLNAHGGILDDEMLAYCEVLGDAFNYRTLRFARSFRRLHCLTVTAHVEFFAGALMNDRELQVPIYRAHIAAALTGEGEVHIAEIPGEGVVGVSVWCAYSSLSSVGSA